MGGWQGMRAADRVDRVKLSWRAGEVEASCCNLLALADNQGPWGCAVPAPRTSATADPSPRRATRRRYCI